LGRSFPGGYDKPPESPGHIGVGPIEAGIRNRSMSSESPSPEARRVLFLNRSYWPDAEATGQLLTELCEDLAENAFDVAVVCGQPNQNPGNVEFRRSGTETRHGVEIHRVFNFRLDKSNILGRAINLVSYLLTSAFRSLTVRRPDIVVVETDPPLLCYLGLLLSWWFKAKLVVYLQDIYPDVALKLGKLREGMIYRFLHSTMHGAYRRADRVVVLSEDMRDLLLANGVAPERITIIPNWVDTQLVYPVKSENPIRTKLVQPKDFVVMYSGNLGLSQRLEHLIEAAELLRNEKGIRFLLIGGGASKGELQALVEKKKLSNVEFHGYQPKELLAQSLSAADLHYVVLDPAIVSCLMPSKIYGIFASGSAMLVASNDQCELARTVRENDVGYVVSFGDVEALAERIDWSYRHREELIEMGERARRLAVEQYDRSYITRTFGELLLAIVCGEGTTIRKA
jgi:glycosyltransferase involved in cell wall biosynthesis